MLGSNRTKKPTHAEEMERLRVAAVELDARRQEQIRLQTLSINRLLRRINAFEKFLEGENMDIAFRAQAYVKTVVDDGESATTATD